MSNAAHNVSNLAVNEVSGIRARPVEEVIVQVGNLPPIFVEDGEHKVIPCLHESDLMVQLSIHCPFLSHKDYLTETQDYLFSHFDRVFTFHPKDGRSTLHVR